MRTSLLLTTCFLILGLCAKAQERIITAGSAASEIVCALGDCDKIIGTDRTSTYPGTLQSLPSIGYRNSISAEGIISMRPDLIIVEEGYVKDELIEQLSSTGIKTLMVEQKRSFEGTKGMITEIAEVLGRKSEGKKLISTIESDLSTLQERISKIKKRPKVLCVYARGEGNMQVAGSNSPFSLLEFAGAQNAVPEIQGFKPLNAESLIIANPDYVLFFDSGLQSLGGIEGALEITGMKQVTAGKKKQIISMDGVLLTNWGPRVAQAAQELFKLTHPEYAE